ncbi:MULTISPECIES: hypothetical protein [Clostridium]|uniref:hypothetical protein n=1 Tax=Clostridium TaxID=1485 RepID=UPI0018A91B73|nr:MULTISPECIES: hypothetical protein [Clostridium]MDB1934419.1 hypothetical protein [Clostridium tertium]MDB1935920.1 hypothetical protein [Clostridium tertium]MDB1969714.1 hypothetical protein [Clostridium tertium]MDU7363194.1 hypothetical protein [Clostridium sp.]
MITEVFKSNKKIKRHIIASFIIIILFFVFLYFFNGIEKVKLINCADKSYEKAIVVEIVEDNIQEDGHRSKQNRKDIYIKR